MFTSPPKRALTEQLHANVVNPVLTFSTDETCTEEIDNVAVLSCTAVVTFEEHWIQHQAEPVCQLERRMCYAVSQIISAALYLHDRGVPATRLRPDNLMMATSTSGDCYVLVRPSTHAVVNVSDAATTCDDIIQLILHLLRTVEPVAGTAKTTTGSPGKMPAARTQYSKGFHRVVRLLHQRTRDSLVESKNLLHFLLWGPPEDEAKLVAMTMTDRRETAFRVWLEVARNRLLSDIILDASAKGASLEVAEQALFLSSIRESSLLDVTKVLFI